MNESLGGLVNIVIITVFIVIAMGYIAFNINYTKAFRMRDKIISAYEKYEGHCESDCEDEIRQYAREIGYSSSIRADEAIDGYENVNNLYFIHEVDKGCSDTEGIYSYSYEERYYKIITKINLSLPIMDKFMGFNFIYVHGDTNVIKGNTCSKTNNYLIDGDEEVPDNS